MFPVIRARDRTGQVLYKADGLVATWEVYSRAGRPCQPPPGSLGAADTAHRSRTPEFDPHGKYGMPRPDIPMQAQVGGRAVPPPDGTRARRWRL